MEGKYVYRKRREGKNSEMKINRKNDWFGAKYGRGGKT